MMDVTEHEQGIVLTKYLLIAEHSKCSNFTHLTNMHIICHGIMEET